MNLAKFKIFIGKLFWLAFDVSTSIFDFILYTINFPINFSNYKLQANEKRIVFVGELLPPRIPRIAKWLKKEGCYNTVLVCHKRGYVASFNNSGIDETILFRNQWHLKRIICQLKHIYILHGFAPKSYYCNIARKTAKCKYVHDMQDVYSIYYGLNPSMRWLKKELPHERECLEKADGLVAHSLEPNAAYRLYGIKNKPKNIFFPLYCDDDVFIEPKKNFDSSNIQLVYAGGVAGSHRDPKRYGNIQFHQTIETLTKQGIHFHIYPSPSNVGADTNEYIDIAKKNKLFHYHEPIYQEKLADELSKYDLGLLPFFKHFSEQSELKLKYATTLKLFNYLEAGLPVVVSKDISYQSWIIERNAIGVAITYNDLLSLKNILINCNYIDLKKNISGLISNSLSLRKNTKRLIEFYNQIQ